METVKQTGLPSIFADPTGTKRYELCNECSKGLQLAIQPQIEAIVHTQFFKKFNIADASQIRMRFTSRSVTVFNKDSTQKTVEFEDKDKDAKEISLEVLRKANEFWKNCQAGNHYNPNGIPVAPAIPEAPKVPAKKVPMPKDPHHLECEELWKLMKKDRSKAIADLERSLNNRGNLFPVNQNPFNVHLNHVELPVKSVSSADVTYSLDPLHPGLVQNGQLIEPEYMKEFRTKKAKGAAMSPRPIISSKPNKSPAEIEFENVYRRVTHRELAEI